jgi:epoxyqueuosine reductase
MTTHTITERLKAEASRLGFCLSGACPAVAPPGLDRFHDWLSAGYGGEMTWLASRAEAYAHPRHILVGARSLLMLAFPYRTSEPVAPTPGRGRVSRYAWGEDYHDLIRERLNELCAWLRGQIPEASARGVIDTAPLLEREFAQLAGLGWVGKNTLLLNRTFGSWYFLAALVTDVELAHDEPESFDHCGTCTACLDACPTGAFVAPYVLDSRKCISYLTIELRDEVPVELRSGVGDWLLGCDVCQDVCPWNRKAPATDEPRLQPANGMDPIELAGLFDLDEAAFRRRFKHSPLWRPKRRGILRNAAIVLGNQRFAEALPALVRGLADDEPLVRGTCAWALGQFADEWAKQALESRFELEGDSDVRNELQLALENTSVQGAAEN